jgi:hypothetical protein
MSTFQKLKRPVQTISAFLTVAVVIGGLASTLCFANPPASVASSTNSVETKASSLDMDKAAAKETLTGAELYSMNCNRCHQERYPTERTGAQWKTIMLHMQVRANIPVSQAKLILQYLQDNSGR